MIHSSQNNHKTTTINPPDRPKPNPEGKPPIPTQSTSSPTARTTKRDNYPLDPAQNRTQKARHARQALDPRHTPQAPQRARKSNINMKNDPYFPQEP